MKSNLAQLFVETRKIVPSIECITSPFWDPKNFSPIHRLASVVICKEPAWMTAQFIAWPGVVDRSNNTGIHQLEGLRNTRGDNTSPDYWLLIAAQLLRTERSDRSQIRWHYLTNLSSCTQSFNANNPVHKYNGREIQIQQLEYSEIRVEFPISGPSSANKCCTRDACARLLTAYIFLTSCSKLDSNVCPACSYLWPQIASLVEHLFHSFDMIWICSFLSSLI